MPTATAIGWSRPAGPSQRRCRRMRCRTARIAEGPREVARAWLADPTSRYDHGVLGDAIEAGSLVVERRDGRRDVVTLFGRRGVRGLGRASRCSAAGQIVVVKSYLRARLGARRDRRAQRQGSRSSPRRRRSARRTAGSIPPASPISTATAVLTSRWCGCPMPRACWNSGAWRDGALHRTLELGDVSNHVIGSRVLRMSAVADFDGDGHADLAIPSFDRRELRLIAFAPKPRDMRGSSFRRGSPPKSRCSETVPGCQSSWPDWRTARRWRCGRCRSASVPAAMHRLLTCG